MSENKRIYYDGTKLLSFNKTLNIVTSGRSSGKTYYFKKIITAKAVKSIRDAVNRETRKVDESKLKTFVIIRRYLKEINANNLKAFFLDIQHEFSDDVEFKVRGKEFYCKTKDCDEFVKIGEAICLSQASTYKSRNFNTVVYTFYDEASVDTAFYRMIPNEGQAYLDLLSTISRTRKGVRHIMAMNNTGLEKVDLIHMVGIRINPANLQAGYYKSKSNPEVVMEVYENTEEFVEKAKEDSGFIRLIENTAYGRYNLENKSTSVNDIFILPKKWADSKHMCTFMLDEFKISLWYSNKETKFYFSEKHHNDSNPLKYSITDKVQNVDYKLLRKFRTSYIKKMLADHHEMNLVYYESAQVMDKAMYIMSLVGA